MENAALITATAALLAALIGVWSQAFFQARAARLALLERRLSVLEQYSRAMELTIEINIALSGIHPRRARVLLPVAKKEADALMESVTLALHLYGDDVMGHFGALQEEMLTNVQMLNHRVAAQEGDPVAQEVDHIERHDRLRKSMLAAQSTFGEYVARDRHTGLSWRRRIEIRSDAAVQMRDAHLRPQSPYRAGSAT